VRHGRQPGVAPGSAVVESAAPAPRTRRRPARMSADANTRASPSMTAIVDSFFPLLALILLGWFLRRRDLLGASAARELTAFVVWLALPALLFEGIAGASWLQLWQPRFVLAYAGAMVATFLLTFAVLPRTRSFAERCLDCFGATYASSSCWRALPDRARWSRSVRCWRSPHRPTARRRRWRPWWSPSCWCCRRSAPCWRSRCSRCRRSGPPLPCC